MVFSAIAILVGSLVALLMLVAPWVVEWISGPDEEKQALTVDLARVMFPFLLMVSLGAVSMGALNAKGVFGIPALASSVFNVTSVVVGLVVAALLEPEFIRTTASAVLRGEVVVTDPAAAERAILGMAWGVLVGGVTQFLWQLPFLRRVGYRFRPAIDFKDERLRGVFRLMGPAVLGAAAVQVNVLVNTAFAASLGNGPVSWLNYAFRLMQFPIGVFGVAIATATLPAISRATARGDDDGFRVTLRSSLRLVLFLTVPAAVGLIVLADPIIALIYERGNFDASDTRDTAAALACYAGGLVGYSLIKIVAPAFFALDDARTPARVSMLSIVVNLIACALLIGPLGHRGLALSTAVVATLNAVLLLFLLRRRAGRLGGRELFGCAARVAAATAAMVLVCRLAHDALLPSFGDAALLDRSVLAFGPIAAGGAVYLCAAWLLRLPEVSRLAGMIRRGR